MVLYSSVLMQLFKRKPMFKYHSWAPKCPPLPLLPALVGMGASEFPAGWGFPLLSPWLHLPLSRFYHSVKLRILNVEDGQGMPAKRAFLASCNANTCCNRQEKVIVKFSLIFHSRII